jgi:ABC-type transporter Mla MlaB component
MLRLTQIEESRLIATLHAEGPLVKDSETVLEHACNEIIASRRRVQLDLSRIDRIDENGAETLRRLLANQKITISFCPPMIQDALQENVA